MLDRQGARRNREQDCEVTRLADMGGPFGYSDEPDRGCGRWRQRYSDDSAAGLGLAFCAKPKTQLAADKAINDRDLTHVLDYLRRKIYRLGSGTYS